MARNKERAKRTERSSICLYTFSERSFESLVTDVVRSKKMGHTGVTFILQYVTNKYGSVFAVICDGEILFLKSYLTVFPRGVLLEVTREETV